MSIREQTGSEAVIAARERYVARGISTPPLVVARADGARIEDVDGRSYIDFAGGLGCQNTGHGFAAAAIHEQTDRYLHQCFMVGIYEPYVEVCRLLAELSPGRGPEQRSLLVSTGAESVENAVKVARAATGRPGVLVFEHAFHGRTLLTMTMTARSSRTSAASVPSRPRFTERRRRIPIAASPRRTRWRRSSACSRRTPTRRRSPAR